MGYPNNPTDENGKPVAFSGVNDAPRYNAAHPGVSGALNDLIMTLAKALAPRGVTQAPVGTSDAIAAGSGGPEATPRRPMEATAGALGSQF